MSTSLAPSIVLILYLGIGIFVAYGYYQRGSTLGAVSALVAWPVLIGNWTSERPGVGSGPFSGKIQAAFRALELAMNEPVVHGLLPLPELEVLQQSLLRADSRIGMVDRLLEDPAVHEGAAPLREARSRAAREVEQALSEVIQLRIQLGLVALAGDTQPIRGRLQSLGARVRALEEMGL